MAALVRITIALIRHHVQSYLAGGKDLFDLSFHITVSSLVEVRTETQAGQESGGQKTSFRMWFSLIYYGFQEASSGHHIYTERAFSC